MRVLLNLLIFSSLLCLSLADSDPLSDVAADLDRFALAFYDSMNVRADHLVVSQLSVAMALGMILRGAKGQTATEIKKVLQLQDIPDAKIHDRLSKIFSDELHKPRNDVKLTIGNLALVSDDIQVKGDYAEFVRKNYNAYFDSVDFRTEKKEIVDTINGFVNNKTEGLIDKLLDKPLEEDTKIALVNTVDFKGQWVEPFPRENTHLAPFYNMDNTVSQVETMHMVRTVMRCYVPERNLTLLGLNYKGSVTMFMAIPDKPRNLLREITGLTHDEIVRCMNRVQPKRYNFYVPKLKLDYQPDMKAVLTKLGVTSMFDPAKADLSGYSDVKPLSVGKIIQRTVLNFNEEGTDVDKIGSKVTQTLSPGHDESLETVRVNLPFTFGIYDNIHRIITLGAHINKL